MFAKIKNIKFVNIFWTLFFILLFGLLLRGGFSYLDPDYGWHLQVGEEIFYSKSVPNTNHYNFTYGGAWVDHEWLSNLMIFKIHELVGYQALVIFFALLIILILIILNIFIYQQYKDKLYFGVLAALELFGVLASLPHFGVRIQEFALFFVLLVIVIFWHYERKRNWYILLWLPPLFWLWANLHASFLLGLALILAWLGIKTGERFIKYFSKIKIFSLDRLLSNKEIFYLFIAFIFSTVATFFTPYRFDLYDFLSGYQNKAYLKLIQEWLPQYAFPFNYSQLIYLALGATAIILYLYESRQKKQPVDIWTLFLNTLFLILSWQSRRHFPLFFVISLPLMVKVYSHLFVGLKLGYHIYLKIVTLVTLVLASAAQFLVLRPIKDPLTGFCHKYPCEAVHFLSESEEYEEDKLFNDYSWGGFMIAAIPERKLFIDGRLPQLAFAGHTFIEEYYTFFKKEADYEKKLAEYDIGLVLLKAKPQDMGARHWEKIFFRIKPDDLKANNYLQEYLEASPSWQIIYQDDVAKIYYLSK